MATFRLVRTRNHIYKQIKYPTTKWKLNIKTQYLLLQVCCDSQSDSTCPSPDVNP